MSSTTVAFTLSRMKVDPFPYSTEEIRETLAPLRHPFRIAIDRAKNGFNIGAIVRTAHSFMAEEILLIGCEPWYERAAMSMQKYEHIQELPSSASLLAYAEERDVPLIAFEKDHARASLWEADIPAEGVLVFGNENDGIAPEILAAAREIVSIPMYGINHSYPITVAAGIAMAEWARRHASRL